MSITDSASPDFDLLLLGTPALRRGDGSFVPLESARAASLLAYLVLHRDQPHARRQLAFLLWPDSTEEQALTNLRHLIHTLRRTLPELHALVEITPRTLRWRAEAPVRVDVVEMEARWRTIASGGALVSVEALDDALDLWRGELLEGAWDDWLLAERERLRHGYRDLLARLVAALESRGDLERAIAVTDRLLRDDPLDETTYRRLMRLHDARGDRARAVRAYHTCVDVLERELGVEPSPETRAAYEELLATGPSSTIAARPAGRAGRSPFVGRVSERQRLAERWRASAEGQAHLVLVTGEPGVGKTRLVDELRGWCVQRGALAAEAGSYAAEGALAYGPVVTWLRSEALARRVRQLDAARLAALALLLPELLVEFPGLPRLEPLAEDDQRQRLFDAIVAAIVPATGPLLLVADDLHWADQETLRVLHYLLRVVPRAPVLIAATARTEELEHQRPFATFLTGLRALDCLTTIELGRLSRDETAAIAEHAVGQRLEAHDAARLYTETEGNPLFIVEAIRAGWASGAGTFALSPRVQAVIRARFDQLGEPARHLLAVAATIGRAFTTDVLARAAATDPETMVRALDELWRRRIVREQGVDAYDFTHDKLREVAYQSLGPALRRDVHLRVARALEAGGESGEHPSAQIAAHYDQAGMAEQAVDWYARAAEDAQHLYANQEAVRLLGRAIEMLRRLPDTTERQQRELTILTALPAPLVAIEGYRSARLRDAHQRAEALAATLGVVPASPLLRSLAMAGLSAGDFDGAREAGERLRRWGERDGDDIVVVQSGYVLGIAAFWMGDLDSARRSFEMALARYRPAQRHDHLLGYGHDPEIAVRMRLGLTLWFLGDPDAAVRERDRALALADTIGHPYSAAVTRVFAAMLALEMRDPERVRLYARHLWDADVVRGAWHLQVMAEAYRGYLDALAGAGDAGIDRIQQAFDDPRGTEPEAPGADAIVLRALLETCRVAGDARRGLAAAERALAASDPARLWRAEVLRLRAEFMSALGHPAADVESGFEAAAVLAGQQGALMLELRALSSLLRWQRQRPDHPVSTDDTRARLVTIVDQIPRGRDLPDVQEAVALLCKADS